MKSQLKILVIFVLLFAISPFVKAESENPEEETIKISISEKKSDGVNIKWKNINKAKSYLVLNEEKIIYEGKKSEFTVQNLDSGELLNYVIKAFDKDGKQISSGRLVTHTKSDNDKLDMNIVIEEDEVSLDWAEDSKVKEYAIYRDGEFLKSTKKSNFKDNTIENNKEYLYSIVVLNKEKSKEGEDQNNNYLITVPITTVEDSSLQSITKQNALSSVMPFAVPSVTSFKHRTFIKQNQLYLWLDSNCYGGDGATRAFSPTAGTHRTSFGIEIDWTERQYTLIRSVSPTTQYNSGANKSCPNTVVKATKTASSNGMAVTQPNVSSTQAFFRVTHSVGNPFWFDISPNIDYVYDLTIYKNGVTMINGSHDGYPWHEIYRYDSSWKTLYTYDASNSSPNSLLPPMDKDFGVYQ